MGLMLPFGHINAANLAGAWEESVRWTWENGVRIATQYDRPGDPLSRDCSMTISVEDPFAEPRGHLAMPGGFYDLEIYRQEVVDGIHDRWINPEEGKWQYTYHERLAAYTVPGLRQPIDQLQYVVDTLSKVPHSRRAQAVLWKAWDDAGIDHPACLQRLWFRILPDPDTADIERLVVSAYMRSNDAFKAAYMNMFVFTDLQRSIAERISEQSGRMVIPGQYNHIVDSFHIYGSYFADFEGFLKSVETRTWEQRTWRTEDVQIYFDEAREKISLNLAKQNEGS